MEKEKELREKTENELKKEYLKSYHDSVRACERISEQFEELKLSAMCPGVKTISDMPRATSFNQSDLSDYIVAEDELISELLKARYKRVMVYTDIFNRIEALENEDERAVLTYRYIKKMTWEKIACEVHLEWAQLHRIHARALKNFKLPENMIHNDTVKSDNMIA